MKSKVTKTATLKSPPDVRAKLQAALYLATKRRKARQAAT